MIRLFIAAASLLMLAGCASTSRYHSANVTGGDYYYADSDGYHDRSGDAWTRHCSDGSRYSQYDRYNYPDCHALGWQWVGPYGYDAWSGGWTGWGYPYGYYRNPYLAYSGLWGGSAWLGLGGVSTWGYPGYYNAWFGPWWPYSVSYPTQRHPYRDRRRIHREQARQASWQRHQRSGSASGYAARTGQAGTVTRQAREHRRQETLRRYRNSSRQSPAQATPQRRPASSRSMPRGRPSTGIPVNWPVNRHAATRESISRQPRSLPRSRPRPMAPRNADARISHRSVRSMPLPGRSRPQAHHQSTLVRRSSPAARPTLRSTRPRMSSSPQPVTRTRSATLPRASNRTSHRSSHSSRSAMPRGRPASKNDD